MKGCQTVQVYGTTLAYTECGNEENPPLVFLPGLGETKESFVQMMNFLQDRYHCFALDPRGFGDSSDNGPFSSQQFSDDLKSWMEALGLKNAAFVAGSFSCWMLIKFAKDNSEFVDKIILLDGGYFHFFEMPGFEAQNVEQPVFQTEGELSLYLNEEINELKEQGIEMDEPTRLFIKQALRANYQKDSSGHFVSKMTDEVMNTYGEELDRFELYETIVPHIQAPILLLIAEESGQPEEISRFLSESRSRFLENLSQMQVEFIQNAHHLLMLTNPEECSEKIRTFLTK